MSRLNTKGTSPAHKTTAVSGNGNPQQMKDVEQQLFELLVSSIYGGDSMYERDVDRQARLRQLMAQAVANGSIAFITNAIIAARTAFNMRTLPIVMTVLYAAQLRRQNVSDGFLRRLVCDVIQRADEITDMMAFALTVFGDKKNLPMALKRGIADAFNKFSEYQFAKYDRDGAVKLRDVLFMVHPKPKNEQQGEVFARMRDKNLATPYTWEVELSRNGQLPEGERKTDAEVWTELLQSKKLGYMALLRNLRNIHQAGVDDDTLQERVYNVLSDPAEVAKSKQLPFRFATAFENTKEIGSTKLTRALSKALDASLSNTPVLGKKVWLILDISGSMKGKYMYHHGAEIGPDAPIYKAALFTAALFKAHGVEEVRLTLFSTGAKHVTVNPEDSILSIHQNLMKLASGGGTNLDSALNLAPTLRMVPDTVVLMSDMQVDHRDISSSAQRIQQLFPKDTLKIAFNFNAEQSTPVGPLRGWYQLAGWSERVFDFVEAMRNGDSIVKSLSGPYMGPAAFKAA